MTEKYMTRLPPPTFPGPLNLRETCFVRDCSALLFDNLEGREALCNKDNKD